VPTPARGTRRGTLTDGRLVFDSEGRELKAFHVLDGQGLVLLRRAGIEVVLVTARHSGIAEQRGAELGLQVCTAVKDKFACVDGMRERAGLGFDQVAFMGDDLPDLPILVHAGLAVAPANAHPWIRERVHWRTKSRGGAGAARELCDLLLGAQGHAEAILAEATRRQVPTARDAT
jgi:3-deoxy-D-manno-octulosonate 8-phosphate phosphatase (KDO 8-P phosphatase)